MRSRQHLARLLENHQARNPREGGDQASMIALAQMGISPFTPGSEPGYFVLGAVVLDADERRILLLRDSTSSPWRFPETVLA